MPVSTPAKYPADSAVRQLKWLVVVLVVSNVALGVFSMIALRQADRRYSELINRSVPVLNDLQTLTAYAAQAMVATNPARLATMERAAFDQAAQQAIAAERTLQAEIVKENWLAAAQRQRDDVADAGRAFAATARAAVSAADSGNAAEAQRLREHDLRPAFDRYIIAITKAADVLEDQSHKANDSETRRTSSLSTVLLGVASWPVVVVVGLLALTAAFVLVLMLLFRGREMSDLP